MVWSGLAMTAASSVLIWAWMRCGDGGGGGQGRGDRRPGVFSQSDAYKLSRLLTSGMAGGGAGTRQACKAARRRWGGCFLSLTGTCGRTGPWGRRAMHDGTREGDMHTSVCPTSLSGGFMLRSLRMVSCEGGERAAAGQGWAGRGGERVRKPWPSTHINTGVRWASGANPHRPHRTN